jgi:hypothetical protein
MRVLVAILVPLFLAACGGGGSDGGAPAPPPPANQSVGGIWEGTDSDGDTIVGLVTEAGAFHFIDPFGQGYGTASVSNGNQVSANYTYVADLGTTFSDGSTRATCTLTGTVVERQSLAVNSQCTSTTGNASQVSVTLAFNALYNRDASLATIAGNYNDLGDVLNINGAGVLFEQDASDGCVLNGQVTVVNPAYNAYQVQFTVSNCNANFAELNGTNWSGIGTLDNTVSPEEVIFGVVGNVTVSGTVGTFALVGLAPRI